MRTFRTFTVLMAGVVAVASLMILGLPGGLRQNTPGEAASVLVQQVDLGTLGGPGAATAVNGSGQVVGYSDTASGEHHAFSWTQAGGMVDLGTLGGPSAAWAVNDSGQVVGSSYTAFGYRAFSWTQAGGMVGLGTLGGGYSAAWAVNGSGQVVGGSHTASGEQHAFSWTQAGGMVDLGTLGGGWSYAVAVNGSGQVVGDSSTASGGRHAFSWTPAGGTIDLGTLGCCSSYALAVNGSGQVVGYSYTASGGQHAFSWTQAGGMIDLGTMIGGGSSAATAVNGSGQVVGYSYTAYGEHRAFSWTQAGGMIDLGTLGGGRSAAAAVNGSGQVVGYSHTASSGQHAFSWTQAGGMVDLGTIGGGYSAATAVNGSGQVVGSSNTALGETHATLWNIQSTPTPLPTPPPTQPAGENRKVIFIQGIDSASGECGYTFKSEYSWMVDALLESAYVRQDVPSLNSSDDFFYFSYSGAYCPGDGSVDDQYTKPQYEKSDTCVGVTGTEGGAAKLEKMVSDLLAVHPNARFDIVTHSMGGMVAAFWITEYPERAGVVNSIVTLDSPLRGTADKTPEQFTACDHDSNAWNDLYCEEWVNASDSSSCTSDVVDSIELAGNGDYAPFYTIDATQQGVVGVVEEVPEDRTTLLASDSKAHCKFDDDHSSVWKNPALGGGEPIECWDNFHWPDDHDTDPREPDIVDPSDRADVKGAFLACAVRGLSGSTCIRSLGETLIADATVDGFHAAGTTEVAVSGGEDLEVSDQVEINPGMPNEETRQVTGFGSLILNAPLEFDHEAGERIFRVDSASNPTPTPPVTPTPTPTVTPTPTATASAGMSGDTDCGGDVDAVDALNILRNVAGLPVSAQCLAGSGDIDCDHDIDAVDALGILRYVASLPVNQPQGCAAIGEEIVTVQVSSGSGGGIVWIVLLAAMPALGLVAGQWRSELR